MSLRALFSPARIGVGPVVAAIALNGLLVAPMSPAPGTSIVIPAAAVGDHPSLSTPQGDLVACEGTTGQEDGCPDLHLEKTADAASVVVGGTASYTITVWNTGPATAVDVVIEDTIPAGWTFDGAACDEIASSTEGGEESWSCTVYALGVSDMAGGIQMQVFGPTTPDDCGGLTNTAVVTASNVEARLERTATVTVTCPTLTLDKQADTDLVTVSDGSADPAIVTWTLSWTLDGGSVTNAMIIDQLPDTFAYVDASATDGGVHDELTNTVIWVLPTLSESGSVTFQARVDPEQVTGSSTAVNIAFMSSDQTPMTTAEASVGIALEQELGGNPTPPPAATPAPAPVPPSSPDLPDTSTGSSAAGRLAPLTGALLLSLAVAVAMGRVGRGRAGRHIPR